MLIFPSAVRSLQFAMVPPRFQPPFPLHWNASNTAAYATVRASCRFDPTLGHFWLSILAIRIIPLDVVHGRMAWKESTSCFAVESSHKKSLSFLRSHYEEASRSPCSSFFEELS
ncbi:hypothetical protein RB195_011450 [Necator americanus]|uniref:Uncharacterized protein n=1 Tax=Necator americanus TaxID=51031 RepID=A0ABR1D2H7_NECAM